MRRTSALAGLLSLVLLAFGIAGYVLTSGGFARLFTLVNLLAGGFALISWLAASWSSLGAMAGSRRTRYGANAAIYSVAFLLLLIALNYLATVHSFSFDLTEQRVFSLSPQSLAVIRDLKKPLKLYGFVESGRSVPGEALFQEYRYASPLITYEMVDPNQHPELAERFKVATINTTHLQYGGDSGEGVNATELTEAALTNGLLKLLKSGTKTACFTTGEGEGDLDDAQRAEGFNEFRKGLEGENYTVKPVNLVTEESVPADCTIVVVAGATRPLVPNMVDKLDAFLKQGGRVLAMLRPPRPDKSIDETTLIKLLGNWGVAVGDNIVVDQVVRLFAGPALGLNPTVNSYGAHPITAGFTKQTVFPMVRTVDPADPPTPGLDAAGIAKTSDTSWAETDLKSLFIKQKATFDEGADRHGPVNIATAVTADLAQLKRGKGTARLVVFGATDFADNQYIDNFFNRDFLMNSVDWLAGEANAITIRPRTLRASRFNLTIQEFDLVFVLSVLLIPELLLLVGLAVWWERRN